MMTSRRQIARPGTTPRPVVAVQRPGVATKQGGAGDELFAEELHHSATSVVSRLMVGMIGSLCASKPR
jgi:hypothetical protein